MYLQGDSGSALVDSSTGEQIGTVSWGIPCANNAPDMFARLSAFREWIEETIGEQPTTTPLIDVTTSSS